jgi:hypothetical protein
VPTVNPPPPKCNARRDPRTRPAPCWAPMHGTAEEQLRRAMRPRRQVPAIEDVAVALRRLTRRLRHVERVVIALAEALVRGGAR